jgi:hypothetical protein
MAQGSTPESAGSARPFKYYGKHGEFTLIAPFKPGGAERARALVDQAPAQTGGTLIPTLHNIRVAAIDNDTRMLFGTVYDGDWDQYIDDFVANPEMNALLEALWGTLEGFPGLHSPDVKDYLVKYQVPVDYFWTAYPDTTADRIKRAERVLAGVEQVLDAAG